MTGRITLGTCFGETGLKIRPDVFRQDNCEQKKHVLLCKMSPASHFFLFEKGEKNNKWNLFTVVVKKHFRQTFCPASRSRCIFKNSDSCRHKVFFSRSHAISWQGGSQESSHVQQGGLNSTCFHFHHRQTLHLVRPVFSHDSQTSIATSRRIINCIAIPSVIASSYRPFHVVTRRHTSSHHTVTLLYHRCCHAT